MFVLTAQLAMNSSLRVKICESVCLFRAAIPQTCKLRTEYKTRTSAYHLALKHLPKKDKAKQPAHFPITAEASIEMSVTIASEHMPQEDTDRQVITEYSAFMLVENIRANKILDSIRF